MSTPAIGSAGALRDALFGNDLRLLGDLFTAEQRERGSDLFTAPRPQAVLPGAPDASPQDLQRVEGVADLMQALILRFLTQVGELAHLGHPTYGSRLHELVGEPNTETTRNRAKLFALQALLDEPRVAKVRSISVETDRRRPTWVEVRAAVVAIDEVTELNLVFPVPLEGGTP
ncbi:GPW/gp25 family protein [Nocardioides soli]|uniref:Phage baseplate assembly protein W n=1 Tax=Nocardioides soli TaxID=1036020 RepID=A0A7W4VZU4_9ACTN|nr:GPW/gp25 family protein [Nocardioides soli]MBB3044548.1 phage baseplate assembly protein W [Nocardioides soli]